MKKLALLFAAVFAFAAISCTPDNPVDPGKDDGKEKAKELTTLVSKASTWSVDKRIFDLSFSGEGVTLATQLIGFDAELGTGKYKLVAEASAKAGDAVLEKTLLDSKAVSAGTVQVSKSGKKYTFNFTLTAEGAEVALTWSGDIEWPADPQPKKVLASVLSAQANKDQTTGAVTGISMTLATEGVSYVFDWTTFQGGWVGEGGYLAIDLYSEDGYLHEGIYTVNAVGGVIGEGEFGRGFDTTTQDWSTGQPVDVSVIWGTRWVPVSNGAEGAAVKIEDGIIVVRRTETGWQISWGKEYPTEYVFEGAIEALTEPEASDKVDPKLEITSGLTYTIEDVTASNTDASQQPLSGVTLWRIAVFQGTSQIANFDFVVTAGETSVAGTYEVMSYPDAAGKAGNGFYIAMGDFVMAGGCFYVVEDTLFYIPVGATVTATENADGTLKFEFTGKTQNADYTDGAEGSLLLDNVAKAA